MKAFKTHQRIFTLMCILPIAELADLWKKIFRLIFGLTILFSVLCGLVSSIVYVTKYSNDNLEESVKTVFQIAAYANVTYMMGTAFLKRDNISDVLSRFQKIYDSKNEMPVEYIYA